MSKYTITFAKEGYIKYTSHLDMVRLFERTLKRAEIRLQYSQGFNPHPKIVFAQPLSLGYTAENEIVEIETKEDMDPGKIKEGLASRMPSGIVIKSVERNETQGRNLAALTAEAEFTIEFPIGSEVSQRLCDEFLAQNHIIAEKKQKKTGKLKETDIRDKIYEMTAVNTPDGGRRAVRIRVAQGSTENLSPELLIAAFLKFSGLSCERSEIEVTRNRLIFSSSIE